jgi:hypothetical protein
VKISQSARTWLPKREQASRLAQISPRAVGALVDITRFHHSPMMNPSLTTTAPKGSDLALVHAAAGQAMAWRMKTSRVSCMRWFSG